MNHRNFTLKALRLAAVMAAGTVVSAGVAEAQRRPVPVTAKAPVIERQGKGEVFIPPGFLPPAGMCRIWIDDVPPGQQPAPTDCATALRNRPANGKVIFGDDSPKRSKIKPIKKSDLEQSLGDLINRGFSK